MNISLSPVSTRIEPQAGWRSATMMQPGAPCQSVVRRIALELDEGEALGPFGVEADPRRGARHHITGDAQLPSRLRKALVFGLLSALMIVLAAEADAEHADARRAVVRLAAPGIRHALDAVDGETGIGLVSTALPSAPRIFTGVTTSART